MDKEQPWINKYSNDIIHDHTFFLGSLTLGENVSCQTVTTNGTSLANSNSKRTILTSKNNDFLAGNNALDNQTFNTQVSTNNSTRFATTEYIQSIINNYNLDLVSQGNSFKIIIK